MPLDTGGGIGHAQSADLVSWELTAPISTPGQFGQLEVPQVLEIDGAWFLVFCADTDTMSPARRLSEPGTGTFVIPGPGPLGPFDANDAAPLQVDEQGSHYAGRIVERDGFHLVSWLRTGPEGTFVGELSNPSPIRSTARTITLGPCS